MEGEDYLQHFGVLGMKWGKRNTARSSSVKGYSRKEQRKLNREAKDEFYQSKAKKILNASLENEKNLILLSGPSGQRIMVTGKEFTNHVKNGGAFNVKYSDVYATVNKGGGYQVNQNLNAQYKKQKFERPS